MSLVLRFVGLVIAASSFVLSASAQVVTGTPPFGSFAGGPDVVNLGNLNVHIDIPILAKAGRGTNFTYDLSYDTSVLYPSGGTGSGTWTPVYNWGWRAVTEASTGYVSYSQTTTPWCLIGGQYTGTQTTWSHFTYHDPWGVPHGFGVVTYYYRGSPQCAQSGTTTTATGVADGYTIQLYGSAVQSLVGIDGQKINAPVNNGTGAGSYTDRNGNVISVNSSGQFFDTLSSTTAVLTVSGSGTPTSPKVYSYSPPGGSPHCSATGLSFACYVLNYTNYTVATNFAVSGVGEYKSSAAVPLVSSVVLPDGSQYTFQYEATPGTCTPYSGTTCVTARVKQITLPTGGTIQYAYSGGNNGIFSDGSTATLTRTTPDGQWIYSQVKNADGTTTTTTTDPLNNQTQINFKSIYETSRSVFQGAVNSTLLAQITTTYNGGTLSIPITQTGVTTQLGTNGPKAVHNTFYNSYELVTGTTDFDYPNGTALIRSTKINYASLGNGILGMRSSITVCNGSGSSSSCYGGVGSVVQQATYSYDQSAVSATSGTPQHVSVTGARGNATTVNQYTSTSNFLTQTYTYYDTGNVYQANDVNAAQTTYTYGACGNSFPTSVNEPLGLSRSIAWDCTGGVVTSVTDENSKTSSVTYNDSYYWRPGIQTDALGNQTTFYYQPNPTYPAPTEVAKFMTFNNGNSVVSDIQYKDGLGRTYVDQHWQSPNSSTLDTVSYAYDANGRPNSVSMPCAVGYTNTCSTPKTTQTYDALNRPLVITDGGGGTVTNTYLQNDVLVSVTPAPSGENSKQRQLEYDSLGRLTSVCEITTLPGSGACGQTNTKTGYWTKYTYNALGQITGVTQNAQTSSTQTRAYFYDFIGRLTSETNPESGLTNYSYDTVPSVCYSYGDNQSGNLTGRTDANNATNCFHYDALHRLNDVGSTGSDYNYCKRFRYDLVGNGVTSAPSGSSLSNLKGRLVEAETDNCNAWPPAPMTDEWFSYTARGEASDLYQATPHSGGYYHSVAAFWPNGVLQQLTGYIGSTLDYSANYNVDGEGRVYSNGVLSSTSYNVASQPTQINLASGDSDAFTFDPNTGRMTQFKYNVNSQSVIGNLTWNANGTLRQLAITDPFNSANSQTCNYSHDDLVRITSANCGSAWSQTFGYDPFGNVTPAGSLAFPATYDSATNRIKQVASNTPAYEANGNVTNDFINTYSWDVYGHAATVDGNTTTYDALDRMVENYVSGAYWQHAYSPTGFLMEIPSIQKKFVPLPGGDMVVYYPSAPGGYYYRHTDWLGNSRFASTPSRAMYYDGAYSPFGAPYAYTGTQEYVYTGMEHTYPNAYDFPAREYEIQGRWPSPDPAGLAAVDSSNPQSWNRYAYVFNTPLSLVDPSGLDPNDGCTWNPLVNELTCPVWQQPWLTDTSGNWMCKWFGRNCGSGGATQTGGGSGGGNSAGSTVSTIVNQIKTVVCTVTSPLVDSAAMNNGALGIGVGGSAGAGIAILGVSLQGGVHIVADPQGNVGISATVGGNPGYGVAGAGAIGGIQFANSNAQTIFDNKGFSWSGGGSAGWFGGIGVDGSRGSTTTVTATVGPSIGTKGAGFATNYTFVPKWLSINCGHGPNGG